MIGEKAFDVEKEGIFSGTNINEVYWLKSVSGERRELYTEISSSFLFSNS